MVLKPSDVDFAAISLGKIGWGGRIRTFTILINSEVSYRLDHAPAEFCYGSPWAKQKHASAADDVGLG